MKTRVITILKETKLRFYSPDGAAMVRVEKILLNLSGVGTCVQMSTLDQAHAISDAGRKFSRARDWLLSFDWAEGYLNRMGLGK